MKVASLIKEQQEFIPRNRESRVEGISRQIFQRAQQEAYKQGRPNDKRMIKQIAEKMVNNLSSKILATIDNELQQTNMKQVNPGKEQ